MFQLNRKMIPCLVIYVLFFIHLVISIIDIEHYRSRDDIVEIPTIYPNETYAEFRTRLLQGYNADNGPGENYGTKRVVNLSISLHISSISGVSVEKMEFIIGMYLAQRWRDPRLQFRGVEKMSFYGQMTDKLWTPDTYFPNDKDGYRHMLTRRNTFIRVFPNGTVYYVQRLKVIVSCQMHLHWFPVDKQNCILILESYGHTAQELYLSLYRDWDGSKDSAVTFEADAIQSPEISNPTIQTHEEVVSYGGTTDKYSSIKIEFILKRRIVFYIFDAYMPFVSIVTVAWSSCWFSVQAVPARASVGVVTVLSIVVHNAGIQRQLPHVSYMKALDLYMIVSLCFVMLSLAEFCAAHMLTSRETTQKNAADSTRNNRLRRKSRPRLTAENLDRVTRVAFPSLYIAFNVIYWGVLLKRHSD